jgi:hypothetical protein
MYACIARFSLIAGGLACSAIAHAATIMIESKSDDTVGQNVVYNLRNQISRSSVHKLVYSRDDAGFVISIVTLPDSDGSTIYSAALLMPPFNKKGFDYYINGLVGSCGSRVVENCAANILSGFDDDMARIATAVRDAMQKPK